MKNSFYIVLPSDSSMGYYPNNTVARFITELPEEIRLDGKWLVGVQEFCFPHSFSNLTSGAKVTAHTRAAETPHGILFTDKHTFPSGYYSSMRDMLAEINTAFSDTGVTFGLQSGNRVSIRFITDHESTGGVDLLFSGGLQRTLGMGIDDDACLKITNYNVKLAPYTTNLNAIVPRELFVYSDICESYIVGDVHAPLLTRVNVDFSRFDYHGTQCVTFPNPRYIPVLSNTFRNILIDIRDRHGKIAPFEEGRSTVTLHFKRAD